MENKKNEKWVRNLYRMSIETVRDLSQALSKATAEIQGERTRGVTVADSELYCDMLPMQLTIGNLWLWREKFNDKYARMEMPELLKELYLRLQMLYHYGECKGRELQGVAWSMEPNGVFCLTLRDCMVNMEHTFKEVCPDREGRLFAVGLNLPLLEREDPESQDSHLCGEYDEFVSFCCEFKDSKGTEIKDVYPDNNYTNEKAIRNILGGLDLISEREKE